MAPAVKLSRLKLPSPLALPSVQEDLDLPCFFLASKLRLQSVQAVGSVSSNYEQEAHFLRRLCTPQPEPALATLNSGASLAHPAASMPVGCCQW